MSVLKGPGLIMYDIKRMSSPGFDKARLPLVATGSESDYSTWVARWLLPSL